MQLEADSDSIVDDDGVGGCVGASQTKRSGGNSREKCSLLLRCARTLVAEGTHTSRYSEAATFYEVRSFSSRQWLWR